MVKKGGRPKARSRKPARRMHPHPRKKSSISRKRQSRKSSGGGRHPLVHFGLDGDKPFFVGEMASVKVTHIGANVKPKIKRELEVKRLNERTQLRGVHKDPHVLLNGDHPPKKDEHVAGPPPRSAHGPYPTIVVCGLGFAGMAAARSLLAHLDGKGRVIGIDESDRFTFIPALMAMASGHLKYEDISVSLKPWVHQVGIEFVQDRITSIDTKARKAHTASHEIAYDYCVVALGASSNPLPPSFDAKTLALRNVCDAYAIWDRLVKAASNLAHKAGTRRFDVKVGIIGGGPTGVQLASWMKDGLQRYLDRDYPRRGKAIVTIFSGGPDLLPGLPKKARRIAHEALIRQGVTVHLSSRVKGAADSTIILEDGSHHKNDAVVFCGGWSQSPVLATMGLHFDNRCGLKSSSFLQSVDDPHVFVAGDALCFVPDDLNIPGWKRAQNAHLVADTLAYNLVEHSNGASMESFDVKDTPTIIELKDNGIFVGHGSVYSGYLFYLVAQLIRIKSLLSCKYPKMPFI